MPFPCVPRVVLDTNVVLDWLWFDDPRLSLLGPAIRHGRVCWMATAAMRDELARVIPRMPLRPEGASTEHVLTSFDVHAVQAQTAPYAHQLACTDGDDQKFLDLAVATRAVWLFSRDRAVLKLARRARAFGVEIVVPDGWSGPGDVGPVIRTGHGT